MLGLLTGLLSSYPSKLIRVWIGQEACARTDANRCESRCGTYVRICSAFSDMNTCKICLDYDGDGPLVSPCACRDLFRP
eukprot:1115123-Prorocentrum_minimum.AAC.2